MDFDSISNYQDAILQIQQQLVNKNNEKGCVFVPIKNSIPINKQNLQNVSQAIKELMLDRIPDTTSNLESGLFDILELRLIIQHFINEFQNKSKVKMNRNVFIDEESLTNVEDFNEQIIGIEAFSCENRLRIFLDQPLEQENFQEMHRKKNIIQNHSYFQNIPLEQMQRFLKIDYQELFENSDDQINSSGFNNVQHSKQYKYFLDQLMKEQEIGIKIGDWDISQQKAFKNLNMNADIKRFEIEQGWTEEQIGLYSDQIEADNIDMQQWTNQQIYDQIKTGKLSFTTTAAVIMKNIKIRGQGFDDLLKFFLDEIHLNSMQSKIFSFKIGDIDDFEYSFDQNTFQIVLKQPRIVGFVLKPYFHSAVINFHNIRQEIILNEIQNKNYKKHEKIKFQMTKKIQKQLSNKDNQQQIPLRQNKKDKCLLEKVVWSNFDEYKEILKNQILYNEDVIRKLKIISENNLLFYEDKNELYKIDEIIKGYYTSENKENYLYNSQIDYFNDQSIVNRSIRPQDFYKALYERSSIKRVDYTINTLINLNKAIIVFINSQEEYFFLNYLEFRFQEYELQYDQAAVQYFKKYWCSDSFNNMVNILIKYDGMVIYPIFKELSLNCYTFPQMAPEYAFMHSLHNFLIIIKDEIQFNCFDEQINSAFEYLFYFFFFLTELKVVIYDKKKSKYYNYSSPFQVWDLKKIKVLVRPIGNAIKDIFEIYLIFILSIYFGVNLIIEYAISKLYSQEFVIINNQDDDQENHFDIYID